MNCSDRAAPLGPRSGTEHRARIMTKSSSISSLYRGPMYDALLQESLGYVACALVEELGEWARFVVAAIVAHCFLMLVIMIRRPATPTRGDLFATRVSFLPLVLLAVLCAPVIWRSIRRHALGDAWLGRWLVADDPVYSPFFVAALVWLAVYGILTVQKSLRRRGMVLGVQDVGEASSRRS